jgi:hypothetical protein
LAAGVIAALAIAAPVAEANAETPVTVPLPAVASALLEPLLSSIGPLTPGAEALGGTAVSDVFNGGTTVCVSTAVSNCSVNDAP